MTAKGRCRNKLLALGDVVAATFPEHRPGGREQQEYRPAIVVGLPDVLGRPRFPVVVVIPLTTDREQLWAVESPHLYPRFPVGAGGLRSPSIALLDQVRSLDVGRLARWLGVLTAHEYAQVTNGLSQMLGCVSQSGE